MLDHKLSRQDRRKSEAARSENWSLLNTDGMIIPKLSEGSASGKELKMVKENSSKLKSATSSAEYRQYWMMSIFLKYSVWSAGLSFELLTCRWAVTPTANASKGRGDSQIWGKGAIKLIKDHWKRQNVTNAIKEQSSLVIFNWYWKLQARVLGYKIKLFFYDILFPKSPKIHSLWHKDHVYYLTFQKQMVFSLQHDFLLLFNESKNKKEGKKIKAKKKAHSNLVKRKECFILRVDYKSLTRAFAGWSVKRRRNFEYL